MVELVVYPARWVPLPRSLFQHAEDCLVEAQTVLASTLPDGLLKLRGDVAQGDGGHRRLLRIVWPGCCIALRCRVHHIMMHRRRNRISVPPPRGTPSLTDAVRRRGTRAAE